MPTRPFAQGCSAAHSTRPYESRRSWASWNPKVPPRAACPAKVGDDVHIALRNEGVGRSRLNEAHRRPDVLDLSRIRGRGNEDGVAAGVEWTMNVDHEVDPIAHGHRYVSVAPRAVVGFGQVLGPARWSGVHSAVADLAPCPRFGATLVIGPSLLSCCSETHVPVLVSLPRGYSIAEVPHREETGWSVTGASPGRMDGLGRAPWHRLIDVHQQRAELTQLRQGELGDRSDFSQIVPEIFDRALSALPRPGLPPPRGLASARRRSHPSPIWPTY